MSVQVGSEAEKKAENILIFSVEAWVGVILGLSVIMIQVIIIRVKYNGAFKQIVLQFFSKSKQNKLFTGFSYDINTNLPSFNGFCLSFYRVLYWHFEAF